MSKRQNKSSSNQSITAPTHGLSHIPLLNILSGSDRQRMLKELSETHYGKNDFIFREGDPTEYFHIVKEGTVKCVKSSSEGRECTLKMLMPGDLFCCDAAAFDGGRHPGTARPMGNVSVLRMKKKSYFDMLRRNPDAAMEVIKYLGTRLHEAQEKAKVLALDRADQRLAALLVDFGLRSGVKDPLGVRLTVRLTREDMANMVGTTTETAIRIMGRFKRDRLVSGTANRLVIRDIERLKSLVST
ncbi:Crp/Fnr family transcriptional regulator [Nitrospira sp. KM1]|uniref:Crp/Fnr family transcriptional regulator n=1 Tax=Nitrospira sp. KM1 TaxID=1936990 RepID=UPI0015673C69|nr:Crp/Fnr family transcriptional regulator [Nitrospira sp. KM1]